MQHPDYTVDRKSAPSGDALCNYLISVRKHGLFKLRGRYLLSVEFDHDAAISDLTQKIKQYRSLSHFKLFAVMKHFHQTLLLPVTILYTPHTRHALSSHR